MWRFASMGLIDQFVSKWMGNHWISPSNYNLFIYFFLLIAAHLRLLSFIHFFSTWHMEERHSLRNNNHISLSNWLTDSMHFCKLYNNYKYFRSIHLNIYNDVMYGSSIVQHNILYVRRHEGIPHSAWLFNCMLTEPLIYSTNHVKYLFIEKCFLDY